MVTSRPTATAGIPSHPAGAGLGYAFPGQALNSLLKRGVTGSNPVAPTRKSAAPQWVVFTVVSRFPLKTQESVQRQDGDPVIVFIRVFAGVQDDRFL